MEDRPVEPSNPPALIPERRAGCSCWFVRDGRLRSGWRVVLYVVSARLIEIGFALAVGIAVAALLALTLSSQGISPAELTRRLRDLLANLTGITPLGLGFRVLDTALVLAIIWLFRRFIDKRSFISLGFQFSPGWWREALAGFAFSVAGWVAIFMAGLSFGAVAVTNVAWSGGNWPGILAALAGGLVFNIFVGIAEEADARGYMLQNLAEGINFFPAVLVSSLYFGVLHLLNPGAGLLSTLGIFFAGILLALGYYATGRLWFSIGMHAAWNFAEGPLFGFLVSGLNMGGLFDLRITGPDWLMGGSFGPEAGALAVLVEIGMIVVLFAVGRARRHPAGAGREATRPV